MADSSDLSALPPQIFALLVGTASVRPLWVQLQLLSVAVSKSGKKKMHIYVFRSQPLLFAACVGAHCPLLSRSVHMRKDQLTCSGRETAGRSEKIQTISRSFLSPGLSSLVSFTFVTCDHRRGGRRDRRP